jgi:peptide/nickel transport system substrate-binding protein
VAALALLALAACRPTPRPDTAVLAWEAFPLSFDPRFGQDQASQRLLALTHQGLLKRDANLDLVPDACSAWRWKVPFTVLEFEFAPARAPRFEDGRPLGAEDAKDALEALMDPALASPKAGPFKNEIAALEILRGPEAETLRITLKAPSPGFPSNLVRAIVGIAPRGLRGPRLPGTGPYRIQEVVPEQRILLAAKPGHPDLAGHGGRPQDLELRLMPDATTRLLALRHGTLQASLNNLPPDLLRPGQGFAVRHFPGANLEYVAFNCQHPVLKDPRVRFALALAIDREAMVKHLRGGLAREAWGFYPPELPWGADVRKDLGVAPDLAANLKRAAALLDEAGLRRGPDGIRFRLTLSSTTETEARMKALALQAMWRRLGVELRIASREFGTLLTEVIAGKFEAYSIRWVGASDPEMLVEAFHSAKVPPRGFNRGRFADAEVDRLLEASRRAPDAAARFALLKQVQTRLVALAPYALLWWPDQIAAVDPRFEIDLNGVGDYAGIWRRE